MTPKAPFPVYRLYPTQRPHLPIGKMAQKNAYFAGRIQPTMALVNGQWSGWTWGKTNLNIEEHASIDEVWFTSLYCALRAYVAFVTTTIAIIDVDVHNAIDI